jgi:Tol biopolymer transport system component
VSSLGEVGSQLSISRQGDKLVYVGGSADSEIWRAELPGRDQRGGLPLSARRFASSTRIDRSPQISPDGKKVAFVSSRSGKLEVWVAEADGSNALQVTSLTGAAPVAPSSSPDGKELAFHANVDGNEDLHIVSAAGGKPRRLTKGAGNNAFSSWSRDGKWVWFSSNRTGEFQCWKVPREGGEAVQATKGGGFGGFESADGKFLYYAKTLVSGAIWRVPVGGGEEQPMHESVRALRGPLNFAVTAEGIWTASSQDPLHGFDLHIYRFATRTVEPVGRVNVGLTTGPAVAPDGRWLLFSDQPARRGDLMLVENFR